jgi:hypothetical protein
MRLRLPRAHDLRGLLQARRDGKEIDEAEAARRGSVVS